MMKVLLTVDRQPDMRTSLFFHGGRGKNKFLFLLPLVEPRLLTILCPARPLDAPVLVFGIISPCRILWDFFPITFGWSCWRLPSLIKVAAAALPYVRPLDRNSSVFHRSSHKGCNIAVISMLLAFIKVSSKGRRKLIPTQFLTTQKRKKKIV